MTEATRPSDDATDRQLRLLVGLVVVLAVGGFAFSVWLAARQRELEHRLFGLGGYGPDSATHAISARDAHDRAGRLTRPQEAASLLHRAEHNGDQVLARAIAQHAVDQSRGAMTREIERAWDEVLGAFVEARPHLQNVVEELAQIERLSQPAVLGPFSLARPAGALPSDFNAVVVPS